MNESTEVHVRYHSNTYVARGGAPRTTASATAGAQAAVARLARKLHPDTIPLIELVSRRPDGSELWSVTP